MASFEELWSLMEKSPLMTSEDNASLLSVVRAGKNLRKEGEVSFWDDFISLCSNNSGMSELLGVSPDKISNLPSKIKDLLNKLESHDAENPSIDDDVKMVPTGNNGAFTPTNTDPEFGNMR